MSLIGLRTLVLNPDYRPISVFPLHTIPVEDAVTRVYNETCHVVFEYDREILTNKVKMKWPSVIARNTSDTVDEKVKLGPESLFYRDHGLCAYCEKEITIASLTCDHVIPKSKGGKFSWNNIVSACGRCNRAKADKPPVGLWKPKRQPFKPTYYQLLANRKKFPIWVDDMNWMTFIGNWEAPVHVR